jgi:hypothetical protein
MPKILVIHGAGMNMPRPSWASSPNSKRDSTADQEGRAGDSVIVAAAIS